MDSIIFFSIESESTVSTQPKVKYDVVIKTSNEMGAGTNSHVLVSIHGDKGSVSSGPLRYDSSKREAFTKGSLDKFELELNNVGQVHASEEFSFFMTNLF
jgi:hypothetical protein